MDLCIHDCEMSGKLRASESFFSYFRVEIVGPIFLSFLKKKNARFFVNWYPVITKSDNWQRKLSRWLSLAY